MDPGTGPFTRALLARGVRENDLTLIEADGDFAALLKRRFPGARIFEMDAVGACAICRCSTARFWVPPISGLPFRLISPRKTLAILEGVFANLRPGGALYQFTLGQRCPFDQPLLDRLDLRSYADWPYTSQFSAGHRLPHHPDQDRQDM